MLKGLQDELDTVTGSSKKSASALKEKEAALKSLNDEIAKTTLTEKEYGKTQIEQKAKEYAKHGVGQEDITRYKQAATTELERRKYEENRRFIRDFELQYQQTAWGIKDATQSIIMEMEQYRVSAEDAFRKGTISAEEYRFMLERIDQMQGQKIIESSRKMGDGVNRALQQVNDEATNLGTQFQNVTTATFSSLSDCITDSAFEAADSWESAGKSILKMLFRIAAQQAIIAPVSGWIGNLFNGGGMVSALTGSMFTGAAGSGINYGTSGLFGFGTAHKGGVAGVAMTGTTYLPLSAFAGPFYYHGGGVAGLKPDEFAAVLRKGEPIFTPEQAATLAPLSEIRAMLESTGGPAAGGGNVTVMQSFAVTVQSNGKDGQQIGQDVSKELMKNMEQGMRGIVRDELMQQARLGGALNPGGYN